MTITLENLRNGFEAAQKTNSEYIGILVNVQGNSTPELIINSKENFESKLNYYLNAYNNDLTLKANANIKITGFTYGNNLSEIERDLVTERAQLIEDIGKQLAEDSRNFDTMVTKSRIESAIEKEEYSRIGKKTTICCLTIKNGFEVIGTSACVDPNNFNEVLGRVYAYEEAIAKTEYLEGYKLQSELLTFEIPKTTSNLLRIGDKVKINMPTTVAHDAEATVTSMQQWPDKMIRYIGKYIQKCPNGGQDFEATVQFIEGQYTRIEG